MFLNYYEILGIKPGANITSIKLAFNKLAMLYHPDRNPGDPIAEEMMKNLNQALRTLSDNRLRKDHDELILKNSAKTTHDAENHFKAGASLADLKIADLQKLIMEYSAAIESNPNDASAYLNRAAAYRALFDLDIAKAREINKSKKRKSKKAKEELIDLGNGIHLELVLILAGVFQMGSDPSDEGHNDDESAFEATISKPFYLGKHQVTQAQWEMVMGFNPSKTKGSKLPVTNVSWNDCQLFIHRLNNGSEQGIRLPTEAEWEFACRAGTTTSFSFGEKITTVDANCDYKIRKPVDVGSYEPNAFGLYDMHGNVFEWCNDWYGDYPPGRSTDPQGPKVGKDRVMRGGSFCVKASSVRSALRNSAPPDFKSNDLGFRIAQTPSL